MKQLVNDAHPVSWVIRRFLPPRLHCTCQSLKKLDGIVIAWALVFYVLGALHFSQSPLTLLVHDVLHMLDGRGFGRQDDLTLHNLGVGVGWRRVCGRVARRGDGGSRHSAGWHVARVCRHRAAVHRRAGSHRIVAVLLHDKQWRMDSVRIGVCVSECLRAGACTASPSSRHRVFAILHHRVAHKGGNGVVGRPKARQTLRA